jgi:hypothetical protein
MSNQAILIDLWDQFGHGQIDETRLRIFALLSKSEQQALIDEIRSELRQPFIV